MGYCGNFGGESQSLFRRAVEEEEVEVVGEEEVRGFSAVVKQEQVRGWWFCGGFAHLSGQVMQCTP